MVVSKEVEVAKELDEMLAAIESLIMVVKQVTADGWQPMQDLPAILVAAVAQLPAAMQGVDQLPEEWKQDPKSVMMAVSVRLPSLVDAIVKKSPQA